MAQYINLDEAIKHLQFDCKAKYPLSYCNGISVAIREIGKLATDDVVEVVRCKDCKYANLVRSCSKYMCEKGCGTLKYSTDFCSYGEAKMKGGAK